MKERKWYEINHSENVDSPALLIFKERVKSNIEKMIQIAGDAKRLVPHVKTHKMAEIATMQMDAGIEQFKCATIAEVEMLATAGAKNILLAYQLNGPKILRFLSVIKEFPHIRFSSLTDNIESAATLNNLAAEEEIIIDVFIDVDSGMHRTGIAPNESLLDLYIQLQELKNLRVKGLHVYDGHIDDNDYEVRKKQCEEEFKSVTNIVDQIIGLGFPVPKMIVGGSPTFQIHAQNKQLYYSPGTPVFWDQGYHLMLPEQPFDFAAILMTRVISKPTKGLITVDLGYKAVASENELSKRITFLNLKDYKLHSQSEEHLVIEVHGWENIHIGDVLYGVPYHVCPSVALYEVANVIENGNVVDKWKIAARSRKISF